MLIKFLMGILAYFHNPDMLCISTVVNIFCIDIIYGGAIDQGLTCSWRRVGSLDSLDFFLIYE